MIVSRKVAEERLSSDRNRLRDSVSGPMDLPIPSDPDPDERDDAIDDERDDERAPQGPITDRSGLSLDLHHLDRLIDNPTRGRYRGQLANQVAIAETATIIGRSGAEDIFALSASQVSAYDKGLQSTSHITHPEDASNPELSRRVAEAKEQIAELAVARLGQTLSLLTTDKLAKVKKATNLTRVGKDLAVILDKVTPKAEVDPSHVHFHVYRPELNVESHYKIVTIGSVRDSD